MEKAAAGGGKTRQCLCSHPLCQGWGAVLGDHENGKTDRCGRDLGLWTVWGGGHVMLQFQLCACMDAGNIPRETA